MSAHPLLHLSDGGDSGNVASAYASTSSLVSAGGGRLGGATLTMRRTGSSQGFKSLRTSLDEDLAASNITTPALRKLTLEINDRTTSAAASVSDVSSSYKGKGKARTSFDTVQPGPASPALPKDGEREVIIHELAKTDTMASICLAYGITPQALRSSNRLWPADSIHLRKKLTIPLDLCNLPASSSIERVSRDEVTGQLVVWEREQVASSPKLRPLGSPATIRGNGMLQPLASPTSQRSRGATLTSQGPSFSVGRNLMDGSSSASSFADDDDRSQSLANGGGSVADYLASTNADYALPSPVQPHPSMLTHAHTQSTASSSEVWSSRAPSPSPSASDDAERAAAEEDPPYRAPTTTLSKRTLQIERVASSSLAFFPPPEAAGTANSPVIEDLPGHHLLMSPDGLQRALSSSPSMPSLHLGSRYNSPSTTPSQSAGNSPTKKANRPRPQPLSKVSRSPPAKPRAPSGGLPRSATRPSSATGTNGFMAQILNLAPMGASAEGGSASPHKPNGGYNTMHDYNPGFSSRRQTNGTSESSSSWAPSSLFPALLPDKQTRNEWWKKWDLLNYAEEEQEALAAQAQARRGGRVNGLGPPPGGSARRGRSEG